MEDPIGWSCMAHPHARLTVHRRRVLVERVHVPGRPVPHWAKDLEPHASTHPCGSAPATPSVRDDPRARARPPCPTPAPCARSSRTGLTHGPHARASRPRYMPAPHARISRPRHARAPQTVFVVGRGAGAGVAVVAAVLGSGLFFVAAGMRTLRYPQPAWPLPSRPAACDWSPGRRI